MKMFSIMNILQVIVVICLLCLACNKCKENELRKHRLTKGNFRKNTLAVSYARQLTRTNEDTLKHTLCQRQQCFERWLNFQKIPFIQGERKLQKQRSSTKHGSKENAIHLGAKNSSENLTKGDIHEKHLIALNVASPLSSSTNCSDDFREKKIKSSQKIASNLSDVNFSRIKLNSDTDKFNYVRTKRSSNDEQNFFIELNTLQDVYALLNTILTPNLTMSPRDKNGSSEAERYCYEVLEAYYSEKEYDGNVYCNSSWDTYSCWPRTLAGTTVTIPCPAYLAGITKTNNATKLCEKNGTWADKANYTMCIAGDEADSMHTEVTHLMAIRVIYNVGFTVSTLALVIALFIFLYFRSLRCLRNSIHCHLIVTFILKNIVWIIMRHTLMYLQHPDYSWCCKMMTSIFNYLHATNFFWMFVEGLYLHVIIVWTYSADKIKLRYLIIIGWGFPSITIIAWIAVRATYENDQCWLPPEGIINYDFIYIGPILLVLCANIIFLATIVLVLITKLSASHTLETRQYRKAVRATIILFPLLGITYVIFIISPSEHPNVKIGFKYINAVLQSFQGLLVAIFYCFLNGEVKGVLKKKLMRYNDARSLSTKFTRTSYGWTRGSRDYGNTVTLANGGLVDTNYRTPNHAVTNTVTESIPLTDRLEIHDS